MPKSILDDQPMDTDEAIAFLRLERARFNRLVAEGQIPYARLGRQNIFLRSDLLAWLRSQIKVAG